MFRAFAERNAGVKLLANMTEFGQTPFFTASGVRGDGLQDGDLAGLSLRVANKAQEKLYRR